MGLPPISRRVVIAGATVTTALALGVGLWTLAGEDVVVYRVRLGDSLPGIARRSGCRVADLVEANGLLSDRVYYDQILVLPGLSELPETLMPRDPALERGLAYRMVSRRQWGAQPLKDNHDPMVSVQRITVHHTAEVPGPLERADSERVRSIQRYHRNDLGWADIGYHFLVGEDGAIYEGRPVAAQGAHVGAQANPRNLGIAVIGYFHKQPPGDTQTRALDQFLREQQRIYRVPTSLVFGHRDFGSTICPGDQLYAWLGAYRDAVVV